MNVIHRMFQVIGLILGLALWSESFAQNAIGDWHAVMESTVTSAGRKNVVALPYFAYVDVAMYDAINSIDDRFGPLRRQRLCATRRLQGRRCVQRRT
jgi:hypothetical protein